MILIGVFGWNEAGLERYRRLGFREVDRRPMRIERDGVGWDAIRMAMAAADLRA